MNLVSVTKTSLVQTVLCLLILACSVSANATYSPFYLVVDGKSVRLGDSLQKLINSLGKADQSDIAPQTTVKKDNTNSQQTSKSYNTYQWYYDDGLTFVARINPVDNRIQEASISSSVIHNKSFSVINDVVNPLNTRNINHLEKIYNNDRRCLSFFEKDGLGWLDYVVQDSSNPNQLVIFSAINRTKKSLTTKQAQQQTKQVNVDSISLTYDIENLSQKIYCK